MAEQDTERRPSDVGRAEKRGLFSGWIRGLGFRASDPPPRRWDLRNVALVSDESDLGAGLYGPRGMAGTLLLPVLADNRFACARTIAGRNGVRVGVDVQHTQSGAANVSVHFRTWPSETAAPTLFAPSVPAVTNLPIYLEQPEELSTRVKVGGLAASAGSLVPVYNMRDVTLAANAFFHIGSQRLAPSLWLAPGFVLDVSFAATSTAINSLAMYLSVYLQEPGSGAA